MPRSAVFVLAVTGIISALTACSSGSTSGAASSLPSASTPAPTVTSTPPSGPTSPPAPTSPGDAGGSRPVGGALTTVTVTRTGGITGAMDELVIAPNGSWVFTNRKTAAAQRGTLSAAQIAALLALVTNPALAAEARVSPAPMACSDSFVYTISMGDLRLRYDQCGGTAQRPATAALVAALTDATAL
jgi:hypothetical protein